MDHFFDDERRQCREKTRSRVSNIQIWRSWIIRTFRFKFSLSSPADRITPIGPHSTDNARNVGVLTTKRDDRSTSFGEWTTNKYIRDERQKSPWRNATLHQVRRSHKKSFTRNPPVILSWNAKRTSTPRGCKRNESEKMHLQKWKRRSVKIELTWTFARIFRFKPMDPLRKSKCYLIMKIENCLRPILRTAEQHLANVA